MSTNTYPLRPLDEVIEKFIDYRGKTPQKKVHGVPLVTAKLIKSGHINEPTEFIAPEDYEKWMTRGFPEVGDVVFTTEAPLGEVAQITNASVALAQRVLVMRTRKELLDNAYLKRVLTTPTVIEQINRRSTGSTVRGIRQKELRKVQIPLPPLSEQKRIANILDKADAIRRKRQEGLKLLADIRSSAFLNLFGDPRNARDDWPQVVLSDVTILDAPMVDPKKKEHLDLIHIGPDRIEKNTGRLLPALTAREEGLISGKFLFDDRYLIYSKIRPYLRKVALPNFKGLCSADVYPIRPIEGMATREYLFALLISEAFLAYTNSLPSRASIPKLNRKELAKYKFHLPPIELQEKYSTILKEHERRTKTFVTAAEKSNELFNSLVQRAFKGEL